MSNEAGNEGASHENDCRPERTERAEGSALPATPASKQLSTDNLNLIALLRRFTPARIALGRTGNSLLTDDLLEFSLDHALARDAVHAPLDTAAITDQLRVNGFESVCVHSAATDRTTYLRRPDLGRQLNDASRHLLSALKPEPKPELVFIIADGLSAIAPQRYAVEVIREIRERLPEWHIGKVVVAEQARVALGDEIGELLQAQITVMLIGERPGLSAPDSLGLYLTYEPRTGRTDAERNCISNVRNQGMSLNQAAETLCYLLTNSQRLKLSGVELKDESGRPSKKLEAEITAAKQLPRNSSKLI